MLIDVDLGGGVNAGQLFIGAKSSIGESRHFFKRAKPQAAVDVQPSKIFDRGNNLLT